jgi:hypothetical protein
MEGILSAKRLPLGKKEVVALPEYYFAALSLLN